MQLSGDLSKVSLPSLVQLIKNSGLTGKVAITCENHNATIFIEKGKIVHIESDIGNGAEAFLEIFVWNSGKFSLVEGKLEGIPSNSLSDVPFESLLREGITYASGKRYLDEHNINANTILVPTDEAASKTDSLPVLKMLDGQKTLAGIFGKDKLSGRMYVSAIYGLLSSGLVKVADTSREEPETMINTATVIEPQHMTKSESVAEPKPVQSKQDIAVSRIQEPKDLSVLPEPEPIISETITEALPSSPTVDFSPSETSSTELPTKTELPTNQIDLPAWVIARLKQDNNDLSQAIIDMVIWVDRIKCWMYQADVDFERIIEELDTKNDANKAANSAVSSSSVEF